MGRSTRVCQRLPSRHLRPTPYPIPSNRYALERKDWEQAICSVCQEAPHNAVLLLCSSHDSGCRPYMCGTSYRHSNCLDLFKKAHSKPSNATASNSHEPLMSLGLSPCKKSDPSELSCPLCRGQVRGWTVVEPARQYLNRKRRSCMQEGCSFVGTYKELRKHVKAEHRRVKPRRVDPVLQEKWRALESQREQQDVMSTIRSSMPRAVVLGDYVIDMDSGSSGMDDFDDDDDEDDGFDEDNRDGRRIGGRGDSRRISRRFLYFLFREGARLARLRRDNPAPDGSGRNADGVDATVDYVSAEEDGYGDGGRNRVRTVDLMRDDRRRERRRRRRGHGRSVSGMS